MVKVWLVGEENTELFICTSLAHITHTPALLSSPLMSNQALSSIKSHQGGPGRVEEIFAVRFRFEFCD